MAMGSRNGMELSSGERERMWMERQMNERNRVDVVLLALKNKMRPVTQGL